MNQDKRCSKCGEVKVIGDFHVDKIKSSGRHSTCKVCRSLEKATLRKRKALNPSFAITEYLYLINRRYRLSYNTLEGMMDEQLGCCGSCGKSLIYPKSVRNYSIDHNHDTGNVRGLLCNECNVALGLLKDDVDTVTGLLKYLIKHS